MVLSKHTPLDVSNEVGWTWSQFLQLSRKWCFWFLCCLQQILVWPHIMTQKLHKHLLQIDCQDLFLKVSLSFCRWKLSSQCKIVGQNNHCSVDLQSWASAPTMKEKATNWLQASGFLWWSSFLVSLHSSIFLVQSYQSVALSFPVCIWTF